MEARAKARYVRVTPRKARRVVDLIRGMPADRAQATLAFAPQSASDPVGKVLASAIANAGQTDVVLNVVDTLKALSFSESDIIGACDELFTTAREAVAGPGWRRVIHMGIAPGVENSTRNRVVGAVTEADADAVVALDPDANMHLIRKLIVGELQLAILHQQPISPAVRSFQLGSKRTLVCLARHLPQASHETLSLGDLTSLPFVTSSALNAGTPVYYAQLRSIFEEAGINRVVDVGAFDLYALQQHIAGGSGFGITFDHDQSAWDNAVVRTVVDLELHLGTWVAWGRKAAEDPGLLRALARLREEYSAAFPAENGGAVLAAGR